MTDAVGSVALCTYDLLNRLTNKAIAPGLGVSNDTTFEIYQYDGRSRLVHAQDNDSLVTRSYDSLSRVIRETLNGQTTTSVYDGVENMLFCIYPGGHLIICAYDELNRKKTITDQAGLIATYNYIGPERVERRQYGNNTQTLYEYDGVKRMTRTTHLRSLSTVFDDRAYTWDAMYNKTSRSDLTPGGLAHTYTYDSIYRLTRSVKTPPSGPAEAINYALDGVGNRTTVTGGPDAGLYTMISTLPEPADPQTNQYTTTPFDGRLYDKNGNLTTIDNGLPMQRDIAYDYRNRMVIHIDLAAGIAATYAYDALGRRIEKVVDDGTPQTTRYFYNGWRAIEEQDAVGITQATYVYGLYIDEVLNMQRGGVDFFYHADELYNVMKVTDAAGSVVEGYDYEDYGQPSFFNAAGNPIAGSAVGNPYLFTGRRFDEESRFYYYRNRYLDSRSGRFIQRDPKGYVDGMGLYEYVRSNPTNLTDPFGASIGIAPTRDPMISPTWPPGSLAASGGYPPPEPDPSDAYDTYKRARDFTEQIQKKILQDRESSTTDLPSYRGPGIGPPSAMPRSERRLPWKLGGEREQQAQEWVDKMNDISKSRGPVKGSSCQQNGSPQAFQPPLAPPSALRKAFQPPFAPPSALPRGEVHSRL